MSPSTVLTRSRALRSASTASTSSFPSITAYIQQCGNYELTYEPVMPGGVLLVQLDTANIHICKTSTNALNDDRHGWNGRVRDLVRRVMRLSEIVTLCI